MLATALGRIGRAMILMAVLAFCTAALGAEDSGALDAKGKLNLLLETWRENARLLERVSASCVVEYERPEHGRDGVVLSVTGSSTTKYDLDGSGYRYEKQSVAQMAGETFKERRLSASNGTKRFAYNWNDNRGQIYIVKDASPPFGLMSRLSVAHGKLWESLAVYDNWGKYTLVSVEDTTYNDSKAVLIEFTRETAFGQKEPMMQYTYRWWVLPEKGCLVARHEVRDETGYLRSESDFSQFEQLPGGAWISRKHHGLAHGPEGAGAQSKDSTLTILEIDDDPEFAPGHFTFEFPPGAVVYDEETEKLKELMKDIEADVMPEGEPMPEDGADDTAASGDAEVLTETQTSPEGGEAVESDAPLAREKGGGYGKFLVIAAILVLVVATIVVLHRKKRGV